MKKFTEWVGAIREAEERQMSELQKSYKDYFGAKLNKFGAKSPADLTEEQKKEFFNEIKKDWEKGQGAKPAGKADVEEHGVKESEEMNEAAKDSPQELAAFIQKEEKHFAAFLKPKKLSATVDGKSVIIKPASGSFTITVDYAKSTIDTTGKPEWPESTSYVEILEYCKLTKFKVNESEDVNGSEEMNEASIEDQIKTEAASRLAAFFRVSPGVLSKFKFDGKDDVSELTKALKSSSNDGTKLYYDAAISMTKKDLGIKESEEVNEAEDVNEADVKNAKDFEEYAMAILKKQHGDDFDEAKASKTIKALSAEAEKDGDWGAAVGKLQNA
jgi:hypothetical protein